MTTPSCPGGKLYTIQAGDTFYLLAKRFCVSLDDILAANPGVDPKNLQIGQVVCIPAVKPPPPPPPPPPCSGFLYTIQAGDTFYLLAKRFCVNLDAVLAANPGVDPKNLQIGQVVCIPAVKPPPPPPPPPPKPVCPGFFYTITAGDTLSELAKRFNTTVKAIIDANPEIDPRNLIIGQKICIPEKQPVKPCPKGTTPYVIKHGDTLESIASKFNTSVQSILKENPGLDPQNPIIGEHICVPRKKN